MAVNQLKIGVILSYLSQGISVIIGLLYTPVMLRLVGQSEYGIYQLAVSVVAYLGLLNFGMSSSYVRYYSRYKARNDESSVAVLNGMFMTVFVVLGIIVIIAGLVLTSNIHLIFQESLSGHEIKTAKTLMFILIINMAVSFPYSVLNSYVTVNEKYIFQRLLGIVSSVCGPFITLPLLLMGFGSVGMVIVTTLLTIVSFIITLIFCRKKLNMKFSFKRFDIELLKDIWFFSFFIFLNMIIDQANWSVDKFVLGMVQGAVQVAIYGIAAQLNTYFIQFSVSISSVFAPRVNMIVAESDDDEELNCLFIKVGRVQFIVIALIITGLIFFGRQFILAWAGAGYELSYYITLLLVIPASISLIQNLGIEIQRAKNMHKFRSIIYTIIAVINIICSIPLSRMYGGIGAAVGTATALIVGNGIIMNIYYHVKIGLNMGRFWSAIFKFVPALIAPVIVGIVIMKFVNITSMVEVLVWAVVYSGVYFGSMWILGMNESERALVKGPINKILKRNI